MGGRSTVIGIAGASCSGKTMLAEGLAAALGTATAMLPMDSYYRDLSHLSAAERAHWNFDSPDAIEHGLFVRDLAALAKGTSVSVPVYDFTTHTRGKHARVIDPKPIIVTEGLFTLYWDSARALMDVRIFVEAGDSVCLARRTSRDTRERGRTAQSVAEQFAATVQPMYRDYCEPTRQFADFVLNGHRPIDEVIAQTLALLRQAPRTSEVLASLLRSSE